MAKETLLKKDFREKDVQRIRNLVTKKYGDKTTTQVGYDKIQVDHKEGDIWEEEGRTWTIKDGIKQSYTKLDGIKSLLKIPLTCPKCTKTMKHRLDKSMYPIHRMCFNCVTEMESQLKRDGKYQEYAERMAKGNMLTHIDEAEQFLEEFNAQSNDSYITEDGEIENWEGGNTDNLVQEWKKELEEMKESLNK